MVYTTYYKINDEILEKFFDGKFLKKDMRFIVKDVMKLWGLKNERGTKQINIMGKKLNDNSVMVCEISLWEDEYSYWILVFDENGYLIYDESDGAISNQNKIKYYYNKINNGFALKSDKYEKIRLDIFYPNLYDNISLY